MYIYIYFFFFWEGLFFPFHTSGGFRRRQDASLESQETELMRNHMFPFNFGSVLWDLWDPSPSEAPTSAVLSQMPIKPRVAVLRARPSRTRHPGAALLQLESSSQARPFPPFRGADPGPIAWLMPFSGTVCQI